VGFGFFVVVRGSVFLMFLFGGVLIFGWGRGLGGGGGGGGGGSLLGGGFPKKKKKTNPTQKQNKKKNHHQNTTPPKKKSLFWGLFCFVVFFGFGVFFFGVGGVGLVLAVPPPNPQ